MNRDYLTERILLMNKIKPGDIVLYHGKRCKVDSVKFNNGNPVLSLHSTRGKINERTYYIPIGDVELLESKEN